MAIADARAYSRGLACIQCEVNWWDAAAWAIFIFATIKSKSWNVPVGIFAALMSMIGGYPMGIYNVPQVQRFFMFLPASIFSTILLIVILLPGTQKLISGWQKA